MKLKLVTIKSEEELEVGRSGYVLKTDLPEGWPEDWKRYTYKPGESYYVIEMFPSSGWEVIYDPNKEGRWETLAIYKRHCNVKTGIIAAIRCWFVARREDVKTKIAKRNYRQLARHVLLEDQVKRRNALYQQQLAELNSTSFFEEPKNGHS